MKRALLIIGVILIFSLSRVAFREAPSNEIVGDRARETLRAKMAEKSLRAQAMLAASLPKPPALANAASKAPDNRGSELLTNLMPDETGTTSADMSFARDDLFSLYEKDFTVGALEVDGIAMISFRGYEGQFKVQFVIPSKDFVGASVPIFMADEKNPAVNVLGSTTLESSGKDGEVSVNFMPMPSFFNKKPGSEEHLSPREEPSNITTVIFTVDPRKQKGTSSVTSYYSYETKGRTTAIGKFDYTLKPIASETH